MLTKFEHGRNNVRTTPPALLDLAFRLASDPECGVQDMAKLIHTMWLGWDLIDAGDHLCQRLDSDKLDLFVQGSKNISLTPDPDPLLESVYKQFTQTLWAAHAMLNRVSAMTTRDEAQFQAIATTLRSDQPLLPHRPAVVCIRGHTLVGAESLVFSHFIWGHFWPTYTAVVVAGYLHPETQLVFDKGLFFCPQAAFLAFYNLFFNSLPHYDKDCKGAEVELQLIPHLPIMVHYGNPDFAGILDDKAAWNSHFMQCRYLRPLVSAVSVFRLFVSPQQSAQLLYLRRGWNGAVGRRNESSANRNLLNDEEVGAALRSLEGVGGTKVETSTLDLPWHFQVRLVASSNLLLGLHGSAMGSHELWLPMGSILVNIFSPGSCECRWAYCAAADPERLLYVAATTSDANCQLGGSWLDSGREGDFVQPELHYPHKLKDFLHLIHGRGLWNYTRSYNATELVTGLRTVLGTLETVEKLGPDFRDWAASRGHRAACGGFALQMVDDGAGATDELIAALSQK